MQITKVNVTPVELKLRQTTRMAGQKDIDHITAVFVCVETRQGQTAWGCTIAHPGLTGETPAEVVRGCQECASLLPDLHPLNTEFVLDALAARTGASAGVLCAFDLAMHDLLSLTAEMPLYRILGGYRNRIQTSVTIPLAALDESVEMARARASQGFRMLKVKGGVDPEGDVQRVRAIHQALPEHTLRLDADGGYSVQEALDIARALQDCLEMLEQPVAADDLDGLREVKASRLVPVLADQSVKGPASALDLAAHAAGGWVEHQAGDLRWFALRPAD